MGYPLHQPINIADGTKAGKPVHRDGIHVDLVRGTADVLIVDQGKPDFDRAREKLVSTEAASPMPFDADATQWSQSWTIEALPLDTIKADLVTAVNAEVAGIRRAVVGDDPAQIATYDRKGELAKLALADDATAKTLIGAEASATGMTVADLAASIVAKSDAWLSATMTLEGMRRGFALAVEAASTLTELDAITKPDFGPIRTTLGLPNPA